MGYALGIWTQRGVPMRRVCLAAAACAALPDIDLLFFPFIEHRAITHSLMMVFVVAVLAPAIVLPDVKWRDGRWRIAAVLGIAILSHSSLDALSHYSEGIEFLAPFSEQRYRFFWTPLGDPADRLSRQLLQETLVVFIPALLLVWLGLRTKHPR